MGLGGNEMITSSGDSGFHVLFLCKANSARSIFAEAILAKLGQGRFVAHSAGSRPAGHLHPMAVQVLENLHFPMHEFHSKSWEAYNGPGVPQMDFVFTVCDQTLEDECPVWPGAPMTAHWGIPDPVEIQGTEAERSFAFHEAFRMLHRRIEAFVALPLESLDGLALRNQIREIGRLRDRNNGSAAEKVS